jgi:hypothetical protein
MTLQGVSRASAALICVGLVAALFFSMLVTNPTDLGPTLVTLWFVGFWVVLSSCLALAKYELVARFGKEATKVNRHKMVITSVRHGALIGAGLTILLALSSLQQLDIRDVGLVAVLLVLIEVFVRARS